MNHKHHMISLAKNLPIIYSQDLTAIHTSYFKSNLKEKSTLNFSPLLSKIEAEYKRAKRRVSSSTLATFLKKKITSEFVFFKTKR